MADKSKIMADIKRLGPVDRMSPLKKKRYDKLMKLYQTLAKQDKNKAESIKNTGRTSANDTEDKRIVGKNDKGEKVVKGTVMGNLKSNEAARNVKVEKPKLRPKKAQFSEDSEIYKKKPKKIVNSIDSENYKPKKKTEQPKKEQPKKVVPVKKKSRSNIANSSSYDAKFTKKNLEKRGLDPKGRMSEKNYAAATKDDTVKTVKKKPKSGNSTIYSYGGSKIKMAKGYSAGGRIFTGR